MTHDKENGRKVSGGKAWHKGRITRANEVVSAFDPRSWPTSPLNWTDMFTMCDLPELRLRVDIGSTHRAASKPFHWRPAGSRRPRPRETGRGNARCEREAGRPTGRGTRLLIRPHAFLGPDQTSACRTPRPPRDHLRGAVDSQQPQLGHGPLTDRGLG